MKHKIIVLLAFFCLAGGWAQVQDRPFPYYISLVGDERPEGIEEDIQHGPEGEDRYTEHGLFLTRGDQENAFSGFYLDDVEFPANYRIILKFKYAMAEGKESNGSYGDGLSVFLFDAEDEFKLGGHGASLGYSYRDASDNNERKPGLNGAYLGIGLDVYGDSKIRMDVYNEKREGIGGDMNYDTFEDHITIRGGQHRSDRFKGYPVLFTRQVQSTHSSSQKVAQARLDYDTGDYDTEFYNSSIVSELRTRYLDGWDEYKYNNVEIEFAPINNGNDGMRIDMALGPEGLMRSVVSGLYYPNEFKTRDKEGSVYNFQTYFPDNFKIGFAGATGAATQSMIIKDVLVDIPFSPITYDREASLCVNRGNNEGNSIRIDIFKNSRFYIGNFNQYTAGDYWKYIDYHSFRFEDEHGFKVGTGPDEFGEHGNVEWHYEEPGVGFWHYYTGGLENYMYFYPEENIAEGEYSVYFSAHSVDDGTGGPFADHAYRCRPTKVTVVVKKCQSVANPNLPIKVKLAD
ncbi:hypothetical protein [Myroides odoratus]|uniref:hypothetical protein n=1 Tax=Myroides odoratus TaxID=256 RepID=UPI003340CDD3